MDLNLPLLRCCGDIGRSSSVRDADVAQHFLQLQQKHRAIDVCGVLLEAVQSELLHARPFSIFLSTTKSIQCIRICLEQTFSISIRRLAIIQFGKASADKGRWNDAWLGMGSIQGLLDILKNCSVDEVQEFCMRVAPCNTRGTKLTDRAAAIEDLIKGMNPARYPQAKYKTTDKRPIGIFAAMLLPSCSADFVQECMEQGWNSFLYGSCSKGLLLRSHTDVLLRKIVPIIMREKPKDVPYDIQLYLKRLTTNTPATPSSERKFSSSMKFVERLLEKCAEDPELGFPGSMSISGLYFSLLGRCHKHRVSKNRLHDILDLGMRLLETHETLKSTFQNKQEFWGQVKLFWIKWPEVWQDLLIKGLQLGLGGSKDTISKSFLEFGDGLDELSEDRLWSLLKTFCEILFKGKINIEKADDFHHLSEQTWSYLFFKKLPADRGISFLKNLLGAKPRSNFLSGTPHDSILTMTTIGEQKNFNAFIFLTQLQTSSSDDKEQQRGYQRALEEYEDLNRKSSSSRDQQDRALYAKAAGFWAIASDSLELFGRHVSWLARYVKDPLTLKTVFANDAIASKDASDLLSGIPDPLPRDAKLSEISKAVADANEILLTFYEHYKVAKKEPAFYNNDWNAMRSLLERAIQTRIDRARKLQDALDISQAELYTQLWNQTLSMVPRIDRESKYSLSGALQSLFYTMPPKLLATVTENMLDLDNKHRTSQANSDSSEDFDSLYEHMAHSCLHSLTSSDNPIVAVRLGIRTVIDKPEAASWHRQFLGIDFFKRLPARDAEKLLLDFSKAVGEKLEEQSYVKLGEAANAPSIIKVTTVKYLAQLLENAQFLSPEASIEVLLQLFKVATHPDIRLATLGSLLATLDNLVALESQDLVSELSDVTNPLIRKILQALDTVVPVLGSINERHPPKEQDWTEAEEDLSKLPEPSRNEAERPLWLTMVNAARGRKSFEVYFVKNLLLPAFELSIQEHRRWLTLFLKKHNAGFSVEKLPSIVPSNASMLRTFCIGFTQVIPRHVLETYNSYVTFLLRKPSFIAEFAAKLEANVETLNKADVSHFLTTFRNSISSIVSGETRSLIGLIHHTWKPTTLPPQQGITLTQVHAAIIEQTGIVLQDYDENVSTWNSLTSSFRHSTESTAGYQKWATECRPVLEQIAAMIDNRRTPQWEKSVDRRPVILPTSITPRLWAMDYPSPGLTPTQSDVQSSELGKKIISVIKQQLSDTTRLVNRERLVKDIMTVSYKLDARQNVQIGLTLCKYAMFESANNVEEDLRAGLSLRFIANGRDALKKDLGLRKEVHNMMKKWQNSSVEDVRELVLDMMTTEVHGGLWAIVSQKD